MEVCNTSLSMLHCEGERIINAEGKQVFLRGTNLGGGCLMNYGWVFLKAEKLNGIS